MELTKRELFAAMAMQGYLSGGYGSKDDQLIAEYAIQTADVLISNLEGRIKRTEIEPELPEEIPFWKNILNKI